MAVSKSTRGIEEPIPTDMALIGDTRHELHSKSLPRCTGPNFGYGAHTEGSEYRNDDGRPNSDYGSVGPTNKV